MRRIAGLVFLSVLSVNAHSQPPERSLAVSAGVVDPDVYAVVHGRLNRDESYKEAFVNRALEASG
jgi:hypothetical protein